MQFPLSMGTWVPFVQGSSHAGPIQPGIQLVHVGGLELLLQKPTVIKQKTLTLSLQNSTFLLFVDVSVCQSVFLVSTETVFFSGKGQLC